MSADIDLDLADRDQVLKLISANRIEAQELLKAGW